MLNYQNTNRAEEDSTESELGTVFEFKEVHNTTCEHYWIESPDQDPKSNLISLQCKNCWSGSSIDPKELKIENGKMIKL